MTEIVMFPNVPSFVLYQNRVITTNAFKISRILLYFSWCTLICIIYYIKQFLNTQNLKWQGTFWRSLSKEGTKPFYSKSEKKNLPKSYFGDKNTKERKMNCFVFYLIRKEIEQNCIYHLYTQTVLTYFGRIVLRLQNIIQIRFL